MKKKVLIGLGIFVLVIVIGMIYLNYRNRTLSPPGIANFSKEGLSIEITYSKPSKRGRLIFGTEKEGALLPYGVYWRLGANEITEISFSDDVLFNGEQIAAGSYSMYAVPGPTEFEISLNSETGRWGYSEPDYELDVLKTNVNVERPNNSVEQFNIRFEELDKEVLIVFEWSDVKVKIPIEPL